MNGQRIRRVCAGIATVVTMIGAVVVARADARSTDTATYVRTFAGSDFTSVDYATSIQEIPNTGGWIGVHANGFDTPAQRFLEVGIDLPVGAQILAVTFFGCGGIPFDYYLGAYLPASQGFEYIVPRTIMTQSSCPTPVQSTRSGNPLGVAKSGRRYMLGIRAYFATSDRQPAQAWELLGGASITYTCTPACR